MASYATSARFLQIVNWAHRLAGMHMSNYEQLLHIELAFLEAKNVSSHMGVPWHHSCHFLSLPVMFCVFNHWKQFSLCKGVLNNRTWMTAHRCIVLSILHNFSSTPCKVNMYQRAQFELFCSFHSWQGKMFIKRHASSKRNFLCHICS